MLASMDESSLIAEILDLARSWAEDDLGEIDADTPLISRFPDGEDAELFAKDVADRYGLAKPRVDDMEAYRRTLIQLKGGGWFTRFLYRSLREPVVHLRDLTARQLAEIIRAGAWPDAFAFPEA